MVDKMPGTLPSSSGDLLYTPGTEPQPGPLRFPSSVGYPLPGPSCLLSSFGSSVASYPRSVSSKHLIPLVLSSTSALTPIMRSPLLHSTEELGDPPTNLRAFLEFSNQSGDSLASIVQPGPVACYDPGGIGTGVHERWEDHNLSLIHI